MSDPYNSNPYQSSAVSLAPEAAAPVMPDRIAALEVSKKWKRRFRAIEAAGGPALPRFRELPFSERWQIQFNVLGFFLGPFYYLAKGLWRQALVYTGIALALIVVFVLIDVEILTRAVGYGFAAVYAMRANISYYKRVVLGQSPWL